jgi:hypothetical protein
MAARNKLLNRFAPEGRALAFPLLLLFPLAARANPNTLDAESVLALGIVAFWALVVESGLVTLALSFRGICIMPVFITLLMANVGVFVFGFVPLNGDIPLGVLEGLVVIVDSVLVKTLLAFSIFQGEDFAGVTWRRSLVACLIGNGASFLVGVMAG